jgi:MFS family permease
MYVVLVGRLLQGVGGGYLVALAFIAIRHWFDPGLMPKVMALISAVWSMSAFAGPLVGGTFSTFGNWRLAFLVVAAQAIIFIILARKITPKTKISETKDNKKIPLFRLFLISTSVLMIAFAGINVHLIISPLLCILSLIFFLITLRIDRHEGSLNKTRIFPSNPFSLSTRKGAGLLLILMTSIASQSYMVYGPLLLETIHLITPLIAGYMIAFEAVCWGLAAVVVASIKVPNEGLNIKIGIFSLLIALVGLAFFIENGPIWVILIFGGLQGACFGIMWAFLVKRINESALENEENITASSIPTIQQVGFAFGAALTGVVANAFGLGAEVSVSSAKAASFWMFICFIPFALISCIAGMRLAR